MERTSELKKTQWSPEMKDQYLEVVENLQNGLLKWENVQKDKVKSIERKVDWNLKVKSEFNKNVEYLKEQAHQAENDLSKIA